MVDRGGLSTLVANPEARPLPRLSAVEREAAERQRDRARREQGMQMLETDAPRSDENSFGETLSGIWKDMPLYDKAAVITAPVPILGDVVGAGADLITLAKDPSLANLGWLGAGLLPWVPSGGILKAGRKAAAHKAFTNLRNFIPGFYQEGLGTAGQLAAFGKTVPEGLANIAKARQSPKSRAIQKEFNISVADQKTAQKALKVSDEITPKIAKIKKQMAEMEHIGDGRPGAAYTGETRIIQKGKKKGQQEKVKTSEYEALGNEVSNLKSRAGDAAKQAMGQLNQSRSMTKQYFGPNSGLEGLLQNIDKVDHMKNFKTFNVNDYYKTVEDLIPQGIGKEGVEEIFKQIKTLPSIGFNPNKNYQMNIRRVYTGSAGELDQGPGARLYSSSRIGKKDERGKTKASLVDLKKYVFPEGKGYNSNKEFLEKLDETGIRILNRDEVLKGKPAVITGSAKTDAYELGGANYMTAINRRGQATTILNDEHDVLSSTKLNKVLKRATLGRYEDQFGKLPGADRYMNVSEPIVVDLVKSKKPTIKQMKAKDKFKRQKVKATEQAIENYLKVPGVDISGKLPAGFKTKEQWARAQAVAKIQPTHKDYSRILTEAGVFAPIRAAKPLREEEDKKAGGSVMERNPYNYQPRAI